MADWSQLPEDLLQQIASVLSLRIDILRFRSICSSWRFSITPPKPVPLPTLIPIGVTTTPSSPGSFHLSKHLIFNLSSPIHNAHSWIVKLQEVPNQNQNHHLLNPLSHSKIQPLPSDFPRFLDLTRIRASDLGQEYVLRFTDPPGGRDFASDVYSEKVAYDVTRNLLMTIHVSGRLAMFDAGRSLWSVVQDMASPYDDIVLYRGRFCAVDTSGRAVVVDFVDSSFVITEIASPVFGGDRKYLVELEGELVLVDRYLSMGSDGYGSDHDHPEVVVDDSDDTNNDELLVDVTAHFKVFRLDSRGKSWVEMKSLGDGMIFLGDTCSFSVSASHFSGNSGNCIYFTDKSFQSDQAEDGSFRGHCIGVFNMEDASIGPLASYPGRSQPLWPPPLWLTQPSS